MPRPLLGKYFVAFLAAGWMVPGVSEGAEPPELKVGIIGLDTSHAIAFTKLLNDPNAAPELARCRVVAAYPKGSPDIESSVSRVPKYTAEMLEMGVEIVGSITDLLDRVDVVLLETNDGRPHLGQAEQVIQAGKPLFIDKPLAGSLADCVAIFSAAQQAGVPVFSSSSLRFGANTQAARAGALGRISKCETHSPASIEPTHPDLFWYGIHGVESLFTVMGTGCQSVRRSEEGGRIVVAGQWSGERVGVFREGSGYGGSATGDKGVGDVGSYDGYRPLVVEIVQFFRTGEPPVSADETLEIYAFMEAADESKRRDGAAVTLAEVMQRARTTRDFDVVVYGGTSSGVAAAVQARRMGKTAIVIEPGQHLGGLTSGGLGWTDSGNKAVIGGIAREFYQRIKQHYDQPAAWVYGRSADYDRYRPQDDAMWAFEPHVAEQLFDTLVEENGVAVRRGQRLDRATGVAMDGQRIRSITMESGETYTGRMFIDATYEGDLLAAAGVTYAVGRESNDEYGESLNGVATRLNTHNHRFVKQVDPYRTPGDPASGLLPGIQGDDPGEEGSADNRVQAYCYRMCMSNVPENRTPFPKPDGYDPLRYELLLRNFEAGDSRLPLKIDMMPNGKTDTNNNCAFSTDNLGMNYDYPEADYARREEILAEHETYQKGLMWTLANHPRVPEPIRQKMADWGLAADEFTDNGNWPHQLYIREARRMVGDYVTTELDCRRVHVAEDSVGMGSYNMDSHNVQRYVTAEGFAQNEGDVQVSPGGAYVVSYRSIIPRRGEAENLLVPVCVSSSHIAYGSIRMEPVFMVLGQSAATAAAMAIDGKTSVQDVVYGDLRTKLIDDGQVLEWVGPRPAARFSLDPRQLPGVVVDDESADQEGIWLPSSSVSGYVGVHYLHDNDESKGAKSLRFPVRVPRAGKYEVRMSYTANANRATNVPVTVRHAGGSDVVKVDQRRTPPIDTAFVALGEFSFEPGGAAWVEISNDGTDGHVIADAVQLVPAGGN